MKNRNRVLTWRRVLVLGALLLLILGGYKAFRISKPVRSLLARLDDLQAFVDNTGDAQLADVGASLRGAYADIKTLKREVAIFMPLTRFLGWMPKFGGDVQAAPALLDVALSLTEAGTIAFDSLEPLVALAEGGDVEGQPLALVLQNLSDARPDLQGAQTRLAEAVERRADIDDHALSARTANLVSRLDRYLPLMQTALDGGQVLPSLLGASGRQTYLILAQNNDELRATGGFISAVGRLVLEDGELVEVVFEDTYAVDDFSHSYPDSPPPFLRYMGIDQWVFRDANWSPDFPASAQKALELYQISRDLEADGVLAVDQHALQTIVAALAPLEVEGWPEPVTGQNVISLIQLAWSPTDVENWTGFDIQWWRQRKRFVSDLFGALQTKIETSPGQIDWLALARAGFQVLDERHVQVWLAERSSTAADLLAEQGWDGGIRQVSSDYLMVVDSNLGYNKVNALVEQRLDYRVLVSVDGTAQAMLTIQHNNPSSGDAACDHEPHYGVDYEGIMNRCYWDYLRVYAPSGSQLAAATAHPVAADQLLIGERQSGAAEILPEEHGKAVFGSFFVLPRGQKTETRFVYQLPGATLESTDEGWRYRLWVQKQAGTFAIPLQVSLVLPPGATILSVASSDATVVGAADRRSEGNVVAFDARLKKDQSFEVVFWMNDD